MVRLNEYQQKIQDLLTELANYGSSDREVESQLIFDTDHNHYQLGRRIEIKYQLDLLDFWGGWGGWRGNRERISNFNFLDMMI